MSGMGGSFQLGRMSNGPCEYFLVLLLCFMDIQSSVYTVLYCSHNSVISWRQLIGSYWAPVCFLNPKNGGTCAWFVNLLSWLPEALAAPGGIWKPAVSSRSLLVSRPIPNLQIRACVLMQHALRAKHLHRNRCQSGHCANPFKFFERRRGFYRCTSCYSCINQKLKTSLPGDRTQLLDDP